MLRIFFTKQNTMEMKLGATYLVAFAAASFIFILSSQAAQDTSCINRLLPCLNYLNGTRDPPDSCCNPLKSVISSEPECFCSLISIKGTRQAERAGINVTEAQQLPGRCGEDVNPIACLTGSSNSGNSAQNSATASIGFFPSLNVLVTLGICYFHDVLNS
ncbi:hypothetical protein Ancab_003311 [Ancistrocladus abbreviatus]